MQRHLKLYRLPEETKTPGLRKLKAADIPEVCKLLNTVSLFYTNKVLNICVFILKLMLALLLLLQYLSKFDLAPTFTEADFTHWFLPRTNIVDCFVVEKPGTANAKTGSGGTITDFFSFYSLPSTVMSHPTHNLLKAAYSFYNVATTVNWTDLMSDALVMAKKVSQCNTII